MFIFIFRFMKISWTIMFVIAAGIAIKFMGTDTAIAAVIGMIICIVLYFITDYIQEKFEEESD